MLLQVSGSASSLDPPSVTSTMESSLDDATKASAADVLRASNIKEVQPAALFDAAHVEEWSPQLVAYFPLGCALAAARFAAWIAGELAGTLAGQLSEAACRKTCRTACRKQRHQTGIASNAIESGQRLCMAATQAAYCTLVKAN